MNRIINRFLSKIITLFIPLPPQKISLYKPYPNFKRQQGNLTIGYVFLIIILFLLSFTIHSILILVSWCFLLYLASKIFRIRKEFREGTVVWSDFLTFQQFIIENNLFIEKSDIFLSAIFRIKENEDEIIIIAEKRGNVLDSKVENIETEISALVSLDLTSKQIFADKVLYSFIKEKPLRKQVSTSLPAQDDSLLIDIYGDFVVNLKHNFSMLVSGASGAGKSYFTYYWLTRFISQTVEGKHAKLFAIDPKQSDLYKLCRQAGMPTENFGTTNAEAFKIVRAYLKEMENRMAVYDESPAFDSVGIDIGLEPSLLVIEEYSSLVASMDSKQKKEFENMVAIIAQKARSLSMGVLIVMQQPRADSLSSNIREQMVNSIFLGNPSKESAGMMFGTTDLPEVRGKGVGIYSIERGTPKEFESPQFNGDVFGLILPVWKKVACNYHEQMKESRAEYE
ncbi:FtsK/SpoIIIE domain-containing protein [Lactococcus lactis]|uniref:FtsK/SpoIIIE domain-containing protein n=1 Tax=Lactococcus lactis TaxID=1358 RepID=UPI00117A0CF7|nr:FtsK/SpoIIIE domain-containing protein [Lactococcus lactis]